LVRSVPVFRLIGWPNWPNIGRIGDIPSGLDRLGLTATRAAGRNEDIAQGLHEEEPEQSDNDAA